MLNKHKYWQKWKNGVLRKGNGQAKCIEKNGAGCNLATASNVTSIAVLWRLVIILYSSSLLRSPASTFIFSSNWLCLPSMILLNVTPDISWSDKRNKRHMTCSWSVVVEVMWSLTGNSNTTIYHFSYLKHINITALNEFFILALYMNSFITHLSRELRRIVLQKKWRFITRKCNS